MPMSSCDRAGVDRQSQRRSFQFPNLLAEFATERGNLKLDIGSYRKIKRYIGEILAGSGVLDFLEYETQLFAAQTTDYLFTHLEYETR